MLKIIIFGDSIVAGRNVRKVRSWPLLLVDHFDSKDPHTALIYNLGITGDTALGVLSRLPAETQARCERKDDEDTLIAIFSVGINDAKGRTKDETSDRLFDNFAQNIQAIIEAVKNIVDRVYFLGITPVDESKMRQQLIPLNNNRIAKCDRVLKKICDTNKIVFIDIFPDWLIHDYPRLLGDDGMHPNEEGHERIFQEVILAISK